MASQTSLDTDELIESMGRFRRWVLPRGVMRELMTRGPEFASALTRHLTQALDSVGRGIAPRLPEAFLCFHLLGVARPAHCRELIGKLFRSDDNTLVLCTGDVTQSLVRALITSLADQDDLASFCDWIDSLVQDDRVNEYAKLQATRSLFNLVGEELLPDSEAVRWTRKWLDERKNLKQDGLTAMIVEGLIDVGGQDLKLLATECFERNQVDQGYVGIDSLAEMSDDRQTEQLRERAESDRQELLDPVSYLEQWHAFAWTADDLDPQSTAIAQITELFPERRAKLTVEEIDRWLTEIDESSYEVYPRAAIQVSHLYVEESIEQLKDRVGRGIKWARQGEPFSSNAPYLSVLMLAEYCDIRLVLMTDADPFLDVIDLTSEQRYEWFGDSIDIYLIDAVSHATAGKTQPILQRIDDSSRSGIDRASLIYYLPISVYHGYLCRNRCLEILRGIWEAALRQHRDGQAGHRELLGAAFDAFCLLSVADDDPVMQQAEEAGIDNLFIAPEVAMICRTEPAQVREIVRTKVLSPRRLEDAIKAGLQFDPTAINPVRPKTERSPSHLSQPAISPVTIRGKSQKTGRNDPCTCGSGKKYKKCCGKR